MKFNIGDRVKTACGTTGTVIDVNKAPGTTVVEVDEPSAGVEVPQFPGTKVLWLLNNMYSLISEPRKILITTDGATTTARLYDGKKVVKSAESKCSPSDTYSFEVGANLAYDRLMRPEVLTAPTPKTEDKPKFKAGDKAKIIGNKAGHRYEMGEIITLTEPHDPQKCRASGIEQWWYTAEGRGDVYESDLEPYTEPSFSWDDFKAGKIAVHCDTEEKAKAFLRECKENGIPKWSGGAEITSETNTSSYGKETCYSTMYGFGYASKRFYIAQGMTIVEYPFTPEPEEPKYYNGKVVCVDDGGCDTSWVVGAVYTISNGEVRDKDGDIMWTKAESLGAINNHLSGKFIEFKGEANA